MLVVYEDASIAEIIGATIDHSHTVVGLPITYLQAVHIIQWMLQNRHPLVDTDQCLSVF